MKTEASGYLKMEADVNTEIESGILKETKVAFYTDTQMYGWSEMNAAL